MNNNTDQSIERIKLEVERQKLQNERYKVVADFLKIVLGTSLVGIVTVWVNADYQNRQLAAEQEDKRNQLEMRRIDKENEFINALLDKMNDINLETKREVSNYFSILLPDGKRSPSERWNKYKNYVEQLIEEKKKAQQQLAQHKSSIEETEKRLAELAKLKQGAKNREEKIKQEKIYDEEAPVLQSRLAEIRAEVDRQRTYIDSLEYVPVKGSEVEKLVEQASEIAAVDTQQAVSSLRWSYVGTYRDDVFVDTSFKVDDLPKVGDTIEAKLDVNQRSREPRWSFLSGWTMGKVLGVLKAGEKLKVDRLEKIPAKGGGYRIWVAAKV